MNNNTAIKFFFFLTALFPNIYCSTALKFILIDPAGHAKDKGRALFQSLERAETYKWAEALKAKLEANGTSIALTRSPGEDVLPFQVASLSNRLQADLFIRLHCCKTTLDKPTLFVYTLVFDPVMDFIKRTIDPYMCISLHQAHFKNIHTSLSISKSLSQKVACSQYIVMGPYGLPLKPLIGICAPAILLELCLSKSDNDWETVVPQLADALTYVLHHKH